MAYMKAYIQPGNKEVDIKYIRKHGKRFSTTAIGTKKWAGEAIEVDAPTETTSGFGTLIFLPGVRLADSGV